TTLPGSSSSLRLPLRLRVSAVAFVVQLHVAMTMQTSSTTNFVMPFELHDRIVAGAYRKRGFTADECAAAAHMGAMAARHGIKTHNAIKALNLDDHFGSRAGGCKPGATIETLPSKYKAVARWNA